MPSLLRATVSIGAGVLLATSVAPLVTGSAAGASSTSGPSSAAVPETKIRPQRLAEGPAPAFAHVEDTTIVDGSVRIPLHARQVMLLGESGADYVAMVLGDGGRRIVRVATDGTQRVLVPRARSLDVVLSGDGDDLITSRLRSNRTTDVRVLDATDGKVVSSRRFRGLLTVLDALEQRVILSSWGPRRTFWWNSRSDLTQRIVKRSGGVADIAANRISTYTDDPYQGGCTTVRNLRRPRTVLWRSCKERVAELAPDGRSMATVDLLSDGIGPGDVLVRSIDGRKVAHYSSAYFGLLEWETPSALVLEANGRSQRALVRCVGATCERVGPLRPTPEL